MTGYGEPAAAVPPAGGPEADRPEPGPEPRPPAGDPDQWPGTVQPSVFWPDRTGHATVDAALQAVAEVADAPPVDQLPAFQAAHRSLRETLAGIDEG